jgi:cell division protein ZapA
MLTKNKVPYIRPFTQSDDRYQKDKDPNGLNQISVDIYGTHYTIKGEADKDYIYSLAKFVNEKMEEVAANTVNFNATKIAILAALNIADEYFQHKEICENSMSHVEKKTRRLISMLNQGLIGDVY